MGAGRLVECWPRAWRWQKLLDGGVYGSVTESAEAERISKGYVSRILRLALLAPGIVEAILGGWADQRVMLERTGAAAAARPRCAPARGGLPQAAESCYRRLLGPGGGLILW